MFNNWFVGNVSTAGLVRCGLIGLCLFGLCLGAPCLGPSASAQTFDDDFDFWPLDLKINGTVIACAAGEVPEEIPGMFLNSAGGDDAVVVVLRFGDEAPDVGPFSFQAGQVKHYDFNADKGFSADLPDALADATGILILDSEPTDWATLARLGEYVEPIRQVIERGGVVCAVGRAATRLGHLRRVDVEDQPNLRPGLQLIPDTVFYDGSRLDAQPENEIPEDEIPEDEILEDEILESLAAEPHAVGIAIPQDTAIVLEGRKIRVYGKRQATFVLSGNERQSARIQRVGAIKKRRFDPYQDIIDLTAWRRDAIERQLPPFPVQQPPTPHVANGTLIIVGGGGMPGGLMTQMVELAGGEKAKMVFVPCSEQDDVGSDDRILRSWKAMGVESAVVFHTKDRQRANTDQDFLEPLKEATGIWFGGGRQWNLADSYYGTEAHRLMKRVLDRGGVIGGSSAGASIQADYLARANPVANFDIMAPGYERGLGFVQGVAIDQHFTQRGRQKDMTQLVNRFPQLLGIGIDETTALIVQHSVAEIVGKGEVYFYDRNRPVVAGEPDYEALGAGDRYDMAARKTLPSKETETAETP